MTTYTAEHAEHAETIDSAASNPLCLRGIVIR